eukprot:CAMPEP_0197579604 /NCGR_PEP_ID=MMETSP1326-20131121/3582_1 /TAXON_ID=1155430 /ORGANISM="Genus nov. species nov., Strain RCC2288" /LENGTH=180 /DNA_ID=CAMNT_0043143125 /DNA_START=63 /DNA_END=602 /DNA_ORIENTATION=-
MAASIDTNLTSPPRLALDDAALLAYMHAHVPRFPAAVKHLRVTQFGHGQSNPTYKIKCFATGGGGGGGAAAVATYVLRKKPPGKILASAHAVEREFAVQAALGSGGGGGGGANPSAHAHASAVPVPAMVALCEDPSVLGTPFYLMQFVSGHIFVAPGLPELPDAAHRAAVYREMARVLGA